MGKKVASRGRSKSSNSSMQQEWEAVMQSNYGTPAISLIKGKGIEVWDVEGKKYLDFLGGIATNILGHSNPSVVAASFVPKAMTTREGSTSPSRRAESQSVFAEVLTIEL